EELWRFEERDLLLARLLECKTFQDAAKVLHERLLEARRTVGRSIGPEEPFSTLAPDPLEQLPLDKFVAAARRAPAPRPSEEARADSVAAVRASVRDAIETVLALLPDQGAIRFRELTFGVQQKLEVIVRFLAVLELFKQGVIDLEQVSTFGDLVVRPLAPG